MENNHKKIVILLAHPNLQESKANKTMIEAVKDPVDVVVFDLYEQRNIGMEEWAITMFNACAIIFQFPFLWMSVPAELKRWMDEVLTSLSQIPTISGKPFLVVTTTGAPFESYRSGGKNCYTVDELLRPIQCSITNAGMVWKTPLVVYGMDTDEAPKNLSIGTEMYKDRIQRLKDISYTKW